MQTKEGSDEAAATSELNPQRPPQNTPLPNEDAESLLYLHPQLTEVEVEGVLVSR